jgi:hypothetical protein
MLENRILRNCAGFPASLPPGFFYGLCYGDAAHGKDQCRIVISLFPVVILPGFLTFAVAFQRLGSLLAAAPPQFTTIYNWSAGGVHPLAETRKLGSCCVCCC